jgi:vacuolar-type H+-ATPase subunit E/Vma4
MSLSELLRTIERDAAAELGAIAAAAAAEVARIDADAARARADRMAAASAGYAAVQQAAADLELASAIRRARIDVLTARAAMLDRIREAVAGELPGLFAAEPRLGTAMVAAAIAYAGGEPGTLRCAPSLGDAAAAAGAGSLRIERDPGVPTGAVIELASGARIDATLAAVLEREWPNLACEALALEAAS